MQKKKKSCYEVLWSSVFFLGHILKQVKTTELGESAINKLKTYELSKTSVQSSKVASSHLLLTTV